MSEENVEIVRRVWNEFQAGLERGDPGAFFDLDVVPDDYEFVLAEQPLDVKPDWTGREEFVEFVRIWTEGFEDYSIQLVRLIDAGSNRVVAVVRQRGTGAGSGATVEFRIGQVFELEGGRLIRCTSYNSDTEALEAAGLSE